MGTSLVAAGRDQTVPTAADTGLPAMRGTAAPTQEGAPSALMLLAGPPVPVPFLGKYML